MNIFNKRFRYPWLIPFGIIIVLALLPLTDFFREGFPAGHDTRDHVARIANFYQNIREGILIPRWAGNLNWGYGHPVLMFLYPLPSYVASVLIFVGCTTVVAVKVVFILGYIVSGLGMFYFLKKLWGTIPALTGATLYLYAPYRFVDLYVRGAIGEHFFFIFPPLILLITVLIVKKNNLRLICFGAFSIAGMILSHNALTIMYLPFIGVFSLVEIWFHAVSKTKALAKIALMWILGFGVSAFFIIPAFFEGKYTLRNIVTSGVIFDRFEALSRIFYSSWNFGGTGKLSVMLGITQWLVVGIGIGLMVNYVWKIKLNLKKTERLKLSYEQAIVSINLFFLFSAIFMMLPASKPLYEEFTLFQKFQFPWRFLSLALFSPAFIAGYMISRLSGKKQIQAASLLIAFSIIMTAGYWKAPGFDTTPSQLFDRAYTGTTDTGESAPIWSVRFMEHEASAPAEFIVGSGVITQVARTSTEHDYTIRVNGTDESENSRIRENTLYFPGWNVKVDGATLPLSSVEFQDPANRGLITYPLSPGIHDVKIVFTNTKLRTFSELITVASLGGIGVLLAVSALSIKKKIL